MGCAGILISACNALLLIPVNHYDCAADETSLPYLHVLETSERCTNSVAHDVPRCVGKRELVRVYFTEAAHSRCQLVDKEVLDAWPEDRVARSL